MSAFDISTIPKLKNPYKHNINPVWGPNTGRNTNSGKFTGSFVGWFDQLILEIGRHNQTEHTSIINTLGVQTIEITFKDTKTGSDKTEWFYLDTIESELENYKKGYYAPMTITMTAISKRGDM